MNKQTWRRARALFEILVELPVEERAALLEAECRDDHALREHLKGLLQADSLERHSMDGGAFRLYSFLIADPLER